MLIPRIFTIPMSSADHSTWHVRIGPLEYEIRTKQARITPKCITWLLHDQRGTNLLTSGAVTVGRSCPFVGTLEECVRAIEGELAALFNAINLTRPS